MTTRNLTTGEINLVRSIFGSEIDVSRVTVNNFTYFPGQPADTAVSPDGSLYFNPNGSLYSSKYSLLPVVMKRLFLHEMTHVWQYQRDGVNIFFRRDPFEDGSGTYYSYGKLTGTEDFFNFNFKQKQLLFSITMKH